MSRPSSSEARASKSSCTLSQSTIWELQAALSRNVSPACAMATEERDLCLQRACELEWAAANVDGPDERCRLRAQWAEVQDALVEDTQLELELLAAAQQGSLWSNGAPSDSLVCAVDEVDRTPLLQLSPSSPRRSICMMQTLPQPGAHGATMLGLVASIAPHLVFGAMQRYGAHVDELALCVPKVLAPFLIFGGLAVQLPPDSDRKYPPSSSVYALSIGVATMVIAAVASLPAGTIAATPLPFIGPVGAANLCDSVASKAVLGSHALLLMFRRIG
eukprot:4370608-Prymnesium_polylepis.1